MQKFPLRTLLVCTALLVVPTLTSAAAPSSTAVNTRVQNRMAARMAARSTPSTHIVPLSASADLSSLGNLRERILSRMRNSAPVPSSSSVSSSRSTASSASSLSSRSRSSSSAPAADTSTFARQVMDLVNIERSKEGLSALTGNMLLERSATKHAQDMRTNTYFDHTALDGRSPTQRIKAEGYPNPSCACRIYYGENIARGQTTPAQVVRDWMNSEGHRKNILSPNFTEIGIGISGTYWVQNFGGVWK